MKTIKIRKWEMEIWHNNWRSEFFKWEILQDFLDDIKDIPTMSLNYAFIKAKSA